MGPEVILAGLMMLGLTLYALLGGADFGAGVWEFNTALRATPKEIALINRAIGPVWEANHVWLIFVIVILFTAFPEAFAALSRALWVPLLLAVVGIMFRGVAFAFRTHASGEVRQERLWGAVFAFASTATPLFLGASAWAIAAGRAAPGGHPVTGWIGPTSIFGAFFTVALCAYLASVYLTREAALSGDLDLLRVWRRRAIAAGMWMGLLAMSGLALIPEGAPQLWAGFKARAWPAVGASVAAGLLSLAALWTKRFTLAAFSAAAAVATVVWGWCLGQYPALVPPAITVGSAKAPDAVLRPMIWAIAAGGILVAPSLAYLLYIFKSKSSIDPEKGRTAS